MSTFKNKADSLFDKILQFPIDSVELRMPIDDNRLELFEHKINLLLPIDYKYMLKKHNGFSVMGTEVNGLDKILLGSSLDNMYDFEHEVNSNLPANFLPISYDGRGNFYCLDLSSNNNGMSPVVFWQSDFVYRKIADVERTNDTFGDWVEEVMINWNS